MPHEVSLEGEGADGDRDRDQERRAGQERAPAIEERALAVQLSLADRGHHRAVSVPDLMVAATAELAGLTVLHADEDFDLIATVTGQPTQWVDRVRST